MEPPVKKKVYINGMGCLSPQSTLGATTFLEDPVSENTTQLKAIDPNYREFVPPEAARRLGRIIKMGIAAAKTCLADPSTGLSSLTDGGIQLPEGSTTLIPDAIITGTGLGCIEDTEKFLGVMIRNNEQFLTPTSFIQSTHNTVTAQIALLLGCHGYNITYVHRGFSFESAILDSLLQINSGSLNRILLGAADEITVDSFMIQERMGFWRRNPLDNLSLLEIPAKGTIAGEGAAFFLLEQRKRPGTYASLDDVEMIFMPDSPSEITGRIKEFLIRNEIVPEDVDLLLAGRNGDVRSDRIYDDVTGALFEGTPSAGYKHLCGEYMTSTSFALWLSARILREKQIPGILKVSGETEPPKRILIYNHYRGINHTLILISQA